MQLNRTLYLVFVFSLMLAACGSVETPDSVADSVQSEAVDMAALEASVIKSDRFWAEPMVIRACGSENGQTMIHWNAPGLTRVEVRAEVPDGQLFALAGPEGSAETGIWVKDQMQFFLLNAETQEVLETLKVRVTDFGCPE